MRTYNGHAVAGFARNQQALATKRRDLIALLNSMGFVAFHHEGETDVCKVSAEEGACDGLPAGDFYDAPGSWPFGVNPILDDVAKQCGLFVEWVNPGCLALYPA